MEPGFPNPAGAVRGRVNAGMVAGSCGVQCHLEANARQWFVTAAILTAA
jgi:hypothetical protein